MTHHTQIAISNETVQDVFNTYPHSMKVKLLSVRELIYSAALKLNINDLDETLKWGEPSYISSKGSAIRLAWRNAKPDQYGVFFNCKTTLIETFKEVYQNEFKYEGNRAIVFDINDTVPIDPLKHCIELSLRYKALKHLPLLGL